MTREQKEGEKLQESGKKEITGNNESRLNFL
jgi:hypothetical protein